MSMKKLTQLIKEGLRQNRGGFQGGFDIKISVTANIEYQEDRGVYRLNFDRKHIQSIQKQIQKQVVRGLTGITTAKKLAPFPGIWPNIRFLATYKLIK